MRGYIPPQNNEETVFCKKSIDLCNKVIFSGNTQYSLFMNLRQQELFIAQSNKFKDLSIIFSSGYDNDTNVSERKIAIVSKFDCLDYSKTTIVCLKSNIKVDEQVSHQDILGALMNLKISREYIGDIVVNDYIYIFCIYNIAPIIVNELRKIKRLYCEFNIEENFNITILNEKNYQKATVKSLRADAVISCILNISRSNAQMLIKQGKVLVNHLNISDNNFEMQSLDVISVKQYGKYKIIYDGVKSKKDRLFIEYFKY